MTVDLPATHALLDTENLFRSFRAVGGPIDYERGRLIRHFPTLTPDVSVALGNLAVHDFVDWLEDRYKIVTRLSFGKKYDPGVKATSDALRDRGFIEHDVPVGKNLADIALRDALRGLAAADSVGHLTLGGEDNLILGEAADVNAKSHGAWAFLIILPDSKTDQWLKFDRGGRYEHLGAVALDQIIDERREVRRKTRDPRRSRRRLTIALKKAVQAKTGDRQAVSYLAGIRAICTAPQFPKTSSPPSQHWMGVVADTLNAAGLATTAAHAVVSWLGTYCDETIRSSDLAVREFLFFAVINLFGGDELNPRTVELTREFVARDHPSQLVPLERAITRALPAEYDTKESARSS